MEFEVGERVVTLDGDRSGYVNQIGSGLVQVLIVDGQYGSFFWYLPEELRRIH